MKTSRKNIDTFFKKALDKMFEAVGFEKWDKEFTKQQDWYSLKTWTIIQQEKYKQWFLNEIKKDLKLNKQLAEKEWGYFLLMWGWRTVE